MSSEATTWALKVRGVSPRAKLVLIAMADSANAKSGLAYPSRKTLAEAADCSVDTVDRCIRELVTEGLVVVQATFDERPDAPRRQTSNRYHLQFTPAADVRPPSRESADAPAAPIAAPQPHSHAAPPAAQDAARIVNQENEPSPSLRSGERAPARKPETVRKRVASDATLPPSLTEPMARYAADSGFVNGRAEALFGAWRDHHISRATPIADPEASFRTWVRNEIKFNPRSTGHAQQPSQPSRLYGVSAQNAEFRARSNRGAVAALRELGALDDGGGLFEPAEGDREG